jgi:hypothetical protein
LQAQEATSNTNIEYIIQIDIQADFNVQAVSDTTIEYVRALNQIMILPQQTANSSTSMSSFNKLNQVATGSGSATGTTSLSSYNKLNQIETGSASATGSTSISTILVPNP